MRQDQRDELARLKFRDLVNSQSNNLMREMITLVAEIEGHDDPTQSNEIIKQRGNEARRLCRSMFTDT